MWQQSLAVTVPAPGTRLSNHHHDASASLSDANDREPPRPPCQWAGLGLSSSHDTASWQAARGGTCRSLAAVRPQHTGPGRPGPARGPHLEKRPAGQVGISQDIPVQVF